jgi:hypothetical protein
MDIKQLVVYCPGEVEKSLNANNSFKLDIIMKAFIKTVPLPKRSDVGKSFAATPATASGWGKIRDSESIFGNFLGNMYINAFFSADGPVSEELIWETFTIISSTGKCANTFAQDTSADICLSGAGQKSVCHVRFFSSY